MGLPVYVIAGYLSGSVLYARIFMKMMGKEGMLEGSRDGNPGTANAFMYGGFWCGLLTLMGDLLKGALPVGVFMRSGMPEQSDALWSALVLAAPVVGHAFPIFYGFRGGKGIAVTFGCLLGLVPQWEPVMALAAFFLFFSLVVRVTPHYYRTLAAYLCSLAGMFCVNGEKWLKTGFSVITVTVCARLFLSHEEKQEMEVKPLWKR